MSYDYIAAGITIFNDIVYADGRRVEGIPGGGIYAWSGIACYTGSVLFSTTGGPDFRELYGRYFEENGISFEGFHQTMPKTHHTVLEYEPDGRWTESSVYGWDYFTVQKRNSMIRAEHLLPFLGPETKGLYIDALTDDGIIDEIHLLREKAPNMKILWEPPTQSSTNPACREAALELIRKTDIYSMNLNEASAFFGKQTKEEILACASELGKPLFLREGEEGATWFTDGKAWHLPPFDLSCGVDPTGCGNSSSAACLYAVCEGCEGYEVTAVANAAAQLNAGQLGPMPVKKLREAGEAKRIAKLLLERIG